MTQKKTFLLRLDNETFKAIEKWAADEFRSVNGQLEWMITRLLKENGRISKPKSRPDPDSEKGTP